MTNATRILNSKPKAVLETTVRKKGVVLKPSIGKARAPMSRYSKVRVGHDQAVLESVVGYDDRERVTATDEYPWCLICFLDITFANGANGIGTGWLIGGNKVLTAGHCVYDERHDGWATAIKVIPGNSVENPDMGKSDFAPYGEFHAMALQTTTEWLNDRNVTFDVGVIHIDHPIADDLGNFGIAIYDDDQELLNKTVRVAGYPLYQNPKNEDGTMSKRRVGGQMWTHSDTIVDIDNGRIRYQLDTSGGQSGAPVVLLDADELGLTAIGAHNYGFAQSEIYHENKATLITSDIWDYIAGWLDEDY